VSNRGSEPVGVPREGAPTGSDLASLLRRCARGDEAAFAEFYDRTSARSWGVALRVIRNPAQAEEVMQEAYLQAWRQSGRFDPGRGTPMSWLLTIVHRTAVDRVRAVEASSQRDLRYARETHANPDPDATAAVVLGSFEARKVRGALDALTELQRQALELAYWGGYTHTEVAGILEVPVGTAKTRIRDGLIRLRDTLGVEV
jgi:RNA polymerase sigma-70 factor (ECF subfamily)